GVERDDPPNELAPDRLGALEFRSGGSQGAGEPSRNLGRNGGEQSGEPARGVAQIGSGENDAGADNAEADLARGEDGEHEGLPVQTADGSELVARDERRGIAGHGRGLRRESPQKRREAHASAPRQR